MFCVYCDDSMNILKASNNPDQRSWAWSLDGYAHIWQQIYYVACQKKLTVNLCFWMKVWEGSPVRQIIILNHNNNKRAQAHLVCLSQSRLLYDTTVFLTQRWRVHAAALNLTLLPPCWALLPTLRANDRGLRRVDKYTYICWALISSTDNSNSLIWLLSSSTWAADSSGLGWCLASGNTTSATGAATGLGLGSAVARTGLRSDGEWDCGFEGVCRAETGAKSFCKWCTTGSVAE